jgi:hypothetical protein
LPKRSRLAHQQSDHDSNARAAAIILAEPTKYAGLPLMWAEDWSNLHSQPAPPQPHARNPDNQLSLF